ncbi:hypothetical protein ACK1FV_004492, partial [Salmonella enterica]
QKNRITVRHSRRNGTVLRAFSGTLPPKFPASAGQDYEIPHPARTVDRSPLSIAGEKHELK